MAKILIDNLSFTYPTAEKPALNKVSFDIKESEFILVIGKSGSGKSTLLRHFKKSLMPYGERSGSISVDGIGIQEMDDRKSTTDIGFVQQSPDNQLVTDMVWHELAFGLENLGLSNQVIKRRVAEMASFFGIQGWFRKKVSELSGGQKQLLNLASVMAMQPKVLVLDEPASQLDPIAASDFLNAIYRINRELGTTVIISEHRLEEVFPMADRTVVMEAGEVLLIDRPEVVGAKLSKMNNGAPHPMYFGMPQVMRAIPEDVVPEGEGLPLTIREGRLFLKARLDEVMKKDYGTASATSSASGAGGATSSASDGDDVVGAGENATDSLAKRREEAEVKNPCVEINDCFFRYDRTSDDVLRGLNLKVEKGEILSILGGNGTGKTTTLKALSGIVKPQRGKIIFDKNLKIAMVPQNPQALFTEITVEEDVLEATIYLNLTDEEKGERVENLLNTMEIAHLRKRNPYDLSGGEQERLAIAKVLAVNPDIILLDEPTKGLDPFFKQTLGRILNRLADDGKTIIMVSHDIDFCAEFSHRCAMFFDGEITAIGESRRFFCGNNFYTTSVNRMVREWKEDLVLPEETKEWLKEIL